MEVAILGIGTAVPRFRIDQLDAAERMADALREDRDMSRFAKRIFRSCGVSSRYTCEPDLLEAAGNCRYISDEPPTTGERMAVYRREALPLASAAARRALTDSRIHPASVTHLMTVSCTGQYLPGLDVELAQELELAADVNRIPLTFNGCAAGLNAVNLARQLAAGAPEAVILLVCVELCTLHIQQGRSREDLLAASFFGDGASACVIGIASHRQEAVIILEDGRSELLPESRQVMTWEVGGHGFNLYLSPEIPRLIGQHVREKVAKVADAASIECWAIHPGGKAIIDAVQETLGLSDGMTEPSRKILRQYGNMSSATILFVLQELKRRFIDEEAAEMLGMALAFGPGLTLEMAKLTFVRRSGEGLGYGEGFASADRPASERGLT
jgi:predicted naringenin-chalcone synthase